jgi:hypothetical protein
VVANRKPVAKPKPKPKPNAKPKPKPAPAPVAIAVASQSLADGQTIQGTVTWQAQTAGPVARVEFLVDDGVRGSATAVPWSYTWDTSSEAPGQHTVVVRAVAVDGRVAEARATVTVAAPAPAPSP